MFLGGDWVIKVRLNMERVQMEVHDVPCWRFFVGRRREHLLDQDKVGKWMFFFRTYEGQQFAERMCREAVESGVVIEAKRSDSLEGVACFYTNVDDNESHKKIISFFLKNDMIKRTKTGRLCDISFKLDSQTYAGSYGSSFHAQLKLSHIMDLYTLQWKI